MFKLKPPEFVKKFSNEHHDICGFIKDVAFSLAVVFVVTLALYLYAGVWPPMVSVNGVSMYPDLQNGDLVFIQGLDRGSVQTYDNSTSTGYSTFNELGNVIVYDPLGDPSRPYVIHRAITWVNARQPMWQGGPPAPHSGYITLGDNNHGVYDQEAPNICYMQPVEPQWIIGVARFEIPYLGYLDFLRSAV
jgi:signal peptidase